MTTMSATAQGQRRRRFDLRTPDSGMRSEARSCFRSVTASPTSLLWTDAWEGGCGAAVERPRRGRQWLFWGRCWRLLQAAGFLKRATQEELDLRIQATQIIVRPALHG